MPKATSKPLTTAEYRKRLRDARAAAKPTVTATKVTLFDVEDWYTPQLLKLSPGEVAATFGKKGEGRVRCVIQEDGWERRSFTLSVMFDQRKLHGEHYNVGDIHSVVRNEYGEGFSGTFTAKDLDNFIDVLVATRDRAKEMELFKTRPKPKSLGDIFPGYSRAKTPTRRAKST